MEKYLITYLQEKNLNFIFKIVWIKVVCPWQWWIKSKQLSYKMNVVGCGVVHNSWSSASNWKPPCLTPNLNNSYFFFNSDLFLHTSKYLKQTFKTGFVCKKSTFEFVFKCIYNLLYHKYNMYIFIKIVNFSKILKGNGRSPKVTFIINNLFYFRISSVIISYFQKKSWLLTFIWLNLNLRFWNLFLM